MRSVSKFWKYAFSIALTLLLSGGCIAAVYVQSCLTRAQRYAEHNLWRHVQQELDCYLWLHPSDDEAHFLMAEALVKDDRRSDKDHLHLAIDHLQQIGRESPLASKASIQKGRLRLFSLDQPARAEEAFTAAMEIDPADAEANYLMWKSRELTSRSFLVEPYFWKCFESSTEEERGFRLREWYISQFFPRTATASFDAAFGILKPGEKPTGRSEAERLLRFRRAEPDRPLAHAAMARWFQTEGDPKFALELIQQAETASQGHPDAFLVATAISVLIDLGDFDQAKSWWNRWPEPRDGYEYWLWTGVIHEQVDADYALAADSFRKAIDVWPGVIDWRTRHRLVNCLQRLGDEKGAADERSKAKQIESLSMEDLHNQLLQVVMNEQDLKGIALLVDYYTRVGRTREAAAWKEHMKYRTRQTAATPGSNATVPNSNTVVPD